MKRRLDGRRQGLEGQPSLLPPVSAGNRVLLLGGKNLTVFQSAGLMFIGVCVAGGVGGLIFVAEFGFGAGSGDHTYALYLLCFASLMILWGLAMFVNGVRGIVRRIRAQRRLS